MRYVGEFADINNKYKYQVTFETKSGSGTKTIQLAGEDPIIIRQDSDKLFDPIKTQSATIKIVSDEYLYPLYNAGYDVKVIIRRKNYNTVNYSIVVFYGYVTPNIYNQTYQYVDEIEIECISDVAMLKYRDYTTISNSGKLIYSMFDIVKKCLNNTRYKEFRFYSPFLYGFSRDAVGQAALISNTIMDEIYLDEVNFFDDNEEQTPWTCYEVLEEIMKIMNLSLVENDGKVYLINYQSNIAGATNTKEFTIYAMSGTRSSGTSTNKYYKVIDEDSYFSSDNNVSLDETYRNVKVKVNTFPYDEVFNEIMNPDNWVLSSAYGTNHKYPSDNRYVPSWDWKDKDDIYHGYFLYFESDKMTPHSYDNNGGTLSPTETQGYIPVLIDNLQAQRQGNYRVGCGLMKLATYKTEEYSVTNKLDWRPQIVLYTGVNTFNVKDYEEAEYSGDRRSSTKRLQDHVNNYMVNNFGSWTNQNHWMPKNPLLEIHSESQINISTDSYLIIDGKMCINDLEWEGSVKEEWSGSDAFSKPTAYKLYDQTIDYPNNRNWIGFPILQLQIRIGNKILCSTPELSEGKQIGMKYKWLTESEFTTTYLNENWHCYIEVPVGAEKFSFFKFYDITNTCDWRLGLDDASGFAVPMPANANLSGNMTIYVVGPVPELYYLYVPDIRKLPTTKKEYVYNIQRNPNNIWDNEWEIIKEKVHIEDRMNGGLHLSYNGVMPSTILVKDLKFEIKEVTYHTYSDTVLKKADNKKTDHEYENIINAGNVIDSEEIECKINTQDLEKCRSFSSMLYKYNNEYQYITTMTIDGGINYRIQEDNIVQNYVNHYSSPKVIFDCDLKSISTTYLPYFSFGSSVCNNPLMLSSQENNLKTSNSKLHLIEI